MFYLHRIFSTLFPHNFPHFYASAPEGTLRKRVVNLASEEQRVFSVPTYPFIKVADECHKMGFILYYDKSDVNFLQGADGSQYYVDTLTPAFNRGLYSHKDNIINHMQEKKYSQRDINIVKESLDRLKEIEESPQMKKV